MRLNEIVNSESFEMLISDVEDLLRHIERLSPGNDFAFVLDFDRRPI